MLYAAIQPIIVMTYLRIGPLTLLDIDAESRKLAATMSVAER